ncbi:MAG: DUF1501 domain-containing protein [Bacteroidales bacterium]|nr:DUF1501 domain-containing protein [Bacteroidales bacterium]
MNRRKFIRNIGMASAGSVMLSGVPVRLLAANSSLKMVAANGNNNVLIFVQLHGGNDALNTLIPVNQYDTYYTYRPNIAIPDSGSRKFIQVDDTLALEDQMGLHPDMIGFKELYDQGKAAIVQNVGYPDMNMSHFRGRDIVMMGGEATTDYSSGWMGRFLNHAYPGYPEAYPSDSMPDPIGIEMGNLMSIAFHREEGIPMGINIHNPDQFYQLITTVGVEPPILYPDSHAGDELRYLMELEKKANQYAGRLKEAYDQGSNSTVVYPEAYPLSAPEPFLSNPLSGQLKLIARLLKGGLKTRIFLCRIGGFDTHGEQVENYDSTLGTHSALLYHLSSAIKAFQDDLAAMSIEDNVLTMTFTEFGRRVYSNASYGTDHGSATPVFLFGKGLKGGVLGTNPNLNDLNNGNLKYTTDYRQVYTSVVQDWLGASNEAMQATGFDQWTGQRLDLIAGITGIDDRTVGNRKNGLIGCYPNPVVNKTTIIYFVQQPCILTIRVYDLSGRSMKETAVKAPHYGRNETPIDLGDLQSGEYLIQIENGNITDSVKILKK